MPLTFKSFIKTKKIITVFKVRVLSNLSTCDILRGVKMEWELGFRVILDSIFSQAADFGDWPAKAMPNSTDYV